METCPNSTLANLVFVAEGLIGLWIWSVWSWRLRMDTSFRAAGAKNLVQEFQSYGYPIWVGFLVGAFKTAFASMLVVAIIYPVRMLTLIGSSGMFILMWVAVLSHAGVKDPLTKFVPATSMLILSIYILLALSHNCVADTSTPVCVPRVCCGVLVAITCFGMWYRSFTKGDYNLDNYEQLDGKAESLMKA